jgi:Flp pilus assembly protein TadD
MLLQQAQSQLCARAYGEAHGTAQRVLQLDPHSAEAYNVLGMVALHENELGEAETLLLKAFSISRRSPHVSSNLGRVFLAQGNYEAAETAYRRAVGLDPLLSTAYSGLGSALRALGHAREAAVHLERYVRREPRDPDGHNRLGLAYLDLGELAQAAERFRVALRMDPVHKAARQNLATTLLLDENYREGWPAWMSTVTDLRFPDPSTASALFKDKRVVIYGTCGVGDEIMYASCLGRLSTQAAGITVHCDRRLVPLIRRSFPFVETIGMEKGGYRRIGAVAADEIHLPACFLPAYFPPAGRSGDGRPSFLVPDPVQVSEWKRRFDAFGPGLKVGVSWRGGVERVDRAQRSIPLSAWAPILRTRGVHFVNLQYGDVDAEIELARTIAPIHSWSDANPLLDLDFSAAQIAALDLVISVSNTTVHMAGAISKPVWALLPRIPHWWWKMKGGRSDWYPSVQLFRQQEARNWTPVLRQVELKLAECVAKGIVAASAAA